MATKKKAAKVPALIKQYKIARMIFVAGPVNNPLPQIEFQDCDNFQPSQSAALKWIKINGLPQEFFTVSEVYSHRAG
jgi:hypothetical protein